jgi:hypothetical protein
MNSFTLPKSKAFWGSFGILLLFVFTSLNTYATQYLYDATGGGAGAKGFTILSNQKLSLNGVTILPGDDLYIAKGATFINDQDVTFSNVYLAEDAALRTGGPGAGNNGTGTLQINSGFTLTTNYLEMGIGAQTGSLAGTGTLKVASLNPVLPGSSTVPVNLILTSGTVSPSWMGTTLTTFNSVEINALSTSVVYASGPVTINGNLTLTNGVLNMLGQNVSVAGDVSLVSSSIGTGSGSLVQNALGYLILNGTTNQTLTSTGSALLNRLRINKLTGSVNLGSNLALPSGGNLDLIQGVINMGSYNVSAFGGATNITNANTTSYFNVNGTGLLSRPVGSFPVEFPVGNGSYTPVRISGASSNFAVGVIQGITNYLGIASPTNDVNRTWTITPSGSLVTPVTIEVQWNGIDQNPGFNPANMDLAYRTGTTGVWNNSFVSTNSAAGFDPFFINGVLSSMNPTTYYFGAFNHNATALPVQLISFNVIKGNDRANLSWSTASELNNQGFYIETSRDNNNWETLGFVNGNGTTQQIHRYSFSTSIAGMNGNIYYRLRQVDFNGEFEYSPVRSINVKGENADATISLFPNPATSVLNINISGMTASNASIRITNLAGVVISTTAVSIEGNNTIIPVIVSGLRKGTYFVQVITPAAQKSATFVKF